MLVTAGIAGARASKRKSLADVRLSIESEPGKLLYQGAIQGPQRVRLVTEMPCVLCVRERPDAAS